MAKNTVHGGPTYGEALPQETAWKKDTRIRRTMLGGEPKLVGDNSTPSSENEKAPNESETQHPQVPAPTMVNPSDQNPPEQADSSAPSTDGNILKTEQQQSAKPRRQRARARTIDVDDDFD